MVMNSLSVLIWKICLPDIYSDWRVSKDINTRKRNSKENNNSTNKVANPTREQEVKIQKSIHTPMIRNNYTMMNIIC